MSKALEHDLNGPFVRSAWSATPEGQTETVWAVEVTYQDGTVEQWNPRTAPLDEVGVREMRQWAYRHGGKTRRVMSVEQVSREVTISATPWAVVEETK